MSEEAMETTSESEQEFEGEGSAARVLRLPKRNLGCGILVAAIEDYLSLDDQAQAGAARFLFPTTPEYREHYEWVVAMAAGVNPAWLRDALDRARPGWDRRRLEKKLARRLQARCSAQGSEARAARGFSMEGNTGILRRFASQDDGGDGVSGCCGR